MYKAGEPGKKLKCPQCSEIALDMNITGDEFNALNAKQKQELKDRISGNVTEDTESVPATPPYEEPDETKNEQQEEPHETHETMSAPAQPEADTDADEDEDDQVIWRESTGMAGDSKIGRLLKLLAKVVLGLSLIGGIVIGLIMSDEIDGGTGFVYGFASALICSIMSLVVWGIGEICILLSSVNVKLDEK